ncbi:MAG: DUF4416 family protein [Candidatus Marinimicrobia bacterium]|nr:DUF4416 family protein [Candidatus Neomarinimicrobiota bacterium]
MGDIKQNFKIQPFTAIMYKNPKIYKITLDKFVSKFGEPLGIGKEYDFSSFTNYYEKEFGTELKKRMLVFDQPQSLQDFHKTKIWSNHLETEISEHRDSRDVNIDPGYLGLSKLVLFSTKNYSHRIYINDGIFAEVTLIYEYSEFKTQSWTYPDYADQKNIAFLSNMRQNIKRKAREKGYMLDLI